VGFKKCTKQIHESLGKARGVAREMAIKFGMPFDAYHCKKCGGWHIGRADKKELIRMKKKILDENIAALGIDPGKTGAIAVVSGAYLEIHDFKDILAAQKTISLLLARFSIKFCVLEKVWLRGASERDVTKAETLIRNSQTWEDLLILNKIDYAKYAPDTWRKGLVAKSGDKERFTQKAIKLFPRYEKEFFRHDRAEAALIAYRAWRHVEAGKPTRLVA